MRREKSPILGRAWDLIACFIIQIPRVRKPITGNLFLFKRTKRFHLLKHYNSGTYIGEYEYSPSNTPLFRYPWRPASKKRKRLLSYFLCGGNAAGATAERGWGEELDVMSMAGDQCEPLDREEVQDDGSVDGRAERFIQRFYEEMRIQRRRSL